MNISKSQLQRRHHCSVEDDALVQFSVDRWRACSLVDLELVGVFGHLAVVATKFAGGNKNDGCNYGIGTRLIVNIFLLVTFHDE